MTGQDGGFAREDPESAEAQIVEQSKRIDFYITEYSVEILAAKMRAGEYVVPDYQREFTWESERKSRFLESLIMGLPIPFIFFWEMPDGKLEIVDGSQRLRTIEEFVLGDFRLGELEQLSMVSNFTFAELPESRQRKIKNRSIRGIVLNEHADEVARLDMFERINTGSKIANTAEIRRGALAGPFMSLVIKLSRLERFEKLAPMSVKTKKERGYEELVTRFFAYGDGLDGYKDRPADFIFEYSRKMNETFRERPELIGQYEQRFLEVLGFVERVFPNGFRKTATSQATPRARFEAIAIGSYLALQDKPGLANASADDLNVGSWLGSAEFVDATGSDGANAIARLRGRVNFVHDKLVAA
ncbi:DUF262 domain-containing protein [Dactylosporangium sp. CA-233914]|uniref:DUF262 domain-containing protein n=1 Tax=Dactylosporangium sp. CA-233914 TaxID=3239934 RepID=UPI003D907E0B